jgi:hypothetical protein
MKIIPVLALSTFILSGCGLRAGTQCTDAPQSEWMDQDAFQQQLVQQGYQINEFVVTDGSCYEIYGQNKEGQNVEIYFNPVNGEIVKEEIE